MIEILSLVIDILALTIEFYHLQLMYAFLAQLVPHNYPCEMDFGILRNSQVFFPRNSWE